MRGVMCMVAGADMGFALGWLMAGATFWGVGDTFQFSLMASRLAKAPLKDAASDVEIGTRRGGGVRTAAQGSNLRARRVAGWAGATSWSFEL